MPRKRKRKPDANGRPATAVPEPVVPPTQGRRLTPQEEDALRERIIARLIALRCKQPERCGHARCRRMGVCKDRPGDAGLHPPPRFPTTG